ncbi:MAG: cellulase family glycosylhydrolase, partial [Chitinophagaceae bacterium]
MDNYTHKTAEYKQHMPHFGAGVNLSALEHTWKTTEELLKADIISKVTEIKKNGFKTIRLPVAFDMFLQPNSSNFYNELVDKLGSIYNECNSLHLNLIITYHYGKVYYVSNNRFSERDRIMCMWKQLQNKFRGMG